MRYTEFKTAHAALEGRSWTAADDTKLLNLQIDKADNIRGLFPYAQSIHLTNAVKLIAMRPDSKWFFDFLTTQLHYLGANGVKGLCFYVNKHEDQLQIWAREDVGKSHIYPNKLAIDFPLDFVTLRAVREGNFWHVSLRQA
jgi:hypothetical protein